MNSHAQKITAEIEVRFRDLDATGRVNNAVHFHKWKSLEPDSLCL